MEDTMPTVRELWVLPCPCCGEAGDERWATEELQVGLEIGRISDHSCGVVCHTCGTRNSQRMPADWHANVPAGLTFVAHVEEVVRQTTLKAVAAWNRRGGVVQKPPHDADHPEHDLCTCGHAYYRHFDWYEDNRHVGCKYCECDVFDAVGLDPDYIYSCWERMVCCIPGCSAEPYGSSPTCQEHQQNYNNPNFRLPKHTVTSVTKHQRDFDRIISPQFTKYIDEPKPTD